MKLQDHQLLAKLSAGDLIAQEAQYHIQYLANRLRALPGKSNSSCDLDAHTVNEGIAFAELISYIEDCCMDTQVAPVFKLTDLMKLYSTRYGQTCSLNEA